MKMAYLTIPPHSKPMPPEKCRYLEEGHCYWCCARCNVDDHICYGCGTPLNHNYMELNLHGTWIKHGRCID